jgi:hypothetical protein
MGRFEAGHPSPFLVDEDRRIIPSGDFPQGTDEGTNLVRGPAIPIEQYKSKGIGFGKKGAVLAAQLRPAETKDASLWHRTSAPFSA